MILLPSRGRPEQLQKQINNYIFMRTKSKVLIILDKDDEPNYRKLVLPNFCQIFINAIPFDLNNGLITAYKMYPDEPFYGFGSDDCWPRTRDWDTILGDAAQPHYLAWGDDGIQGERLPTHPFLGSALAKALGWLIPPHMKRGYIDFTWLDYAKELGVCRYHPEVKTEHLHWQAGKGKFDATYAAQPSIQDDIKRWEIHRYSQGFRQNVKRIKEELKL